MTVQPSLKSSSATVRWLTDPNLFVTLRTTALSAVWRFPAPVKLLRAVLSIVLNAPEGSGGSAMVSWWVVIALFVLVLATVELADYADKQNRRG